MDRYNLLKVQQERGGLIVPPSEVEKEFLMQTEGINLDGIKCLERKAELCAEIVKAEDPFISDEALIQKAKEYMFFNEGNLLQRVASLREQSVQKNRYDTLKEQKIQKKRYDILK